MMQEPIVSNAEASDDEVFLFGPNKFRGQSSVDLKSSALKIFAFGLLCLVIWVYDASRGESSSLTLMIGFGCLAMAALSHKLVQSCTDAMMRVDAEGFTVDMKMRTAICSLKNVPPSTFTWDQVESMRVVAFKTEVYEGSTEQVTYDFGEGTKTTTTTRYYNEQVVSVLALSFKSPKPDDPLLSAMALKPCAGAGPLMNLDDSHDVDLVIFGLAPLFAPEDDAEVHKYQARDTEYVLECFQKYLPDRTLPPMYGLRRVRGNKALFKWGLLSEYKRRLELPVDQRDWESYGD